MTNKLLLYYIIILLINSYSILCCADNLLNLNLVENSVLSVDEINSLNDGSDNNSQPYEDSNWELNSVPMTCSLNKYQKMKCWIYWKTFGKYRREFSSYIECKNRWDPNCYSLRSEALREIKEFKHHPLTYIKKEREYFIARGIAHNNKSFNYRGK